MTLRLAAVVVIGVALGACRPPDFRFRVEHKVVADGVELTAYVNREHVELNIGIIDFSRADVEKETRVLIPWDKLPPPVGTRVEILVNARIPNVIGTEERVYIPASELGSHVRPAAPPQTGPRTVREIAHPTDEQPVVIVGAEPAPSNGAKLSGALGELDNVETSPLRLKLAALPGTTLEYRGKPVPLDNGSGTLEVSADELLMGTPPSYLFPSGYPKHPKLRLSLVQKRGDDTRDVAMVLEGAATDLSTRAWSALEPATRGQSVTSEAGRRGGIVFVPSTYASAPNEVHLIDAPGELRQLRFVSRGELLPRSKSPVRTCRYDRGAYVEITYRQDIRLTAYDLGTGKRLGEKVVPAKIGRCPMTTMTFGNARRNEYSITPDGHAIEAAAKAWAKGGWGFSFALRGRFIRR